MRLRAIVVVKGLLPARLGCRLNIVHAGIRQRANIREPARLEIVKVQRAARARIDIQRAQAHFGQGARVVVNIANGLLSDAIKHESQ